MKKLPKIQVKPDYVQMRGGLDLETPARSIDPGALIAGVNYMASSRGGYERIDGYERFDGQTAPSDGVYYRAPCTFTAGGPSVGDTITGDTSGETAYVVLVYTDYMILTKVSGDFDNDEDFTVAAVAKGTFTAEQVSGGETSAYLDAVAQNATADVYRADIAHPTGSGATRGLVMLNGVLYCFIDNAGATAGLIYKSSSSGWVDVTPSDNEISFDTGTGLVSEGDTITGAVSGATAEVKRVVLESGAWGTDAAGRLIIGAVTGGPFQAENLTVSGVECAALGAEAAIAISPGGRYEFVIYNFTGSTDTKRIYGCDGVNRGFEFDGTVYVPIDTGMTVDTPLHVAAYKYQLFFSFYGSSQNSGVGAPYSWTPVTGASEIAMGDDIIGYSPKAQALLIVSRNRTNQLVGSAGSYTLDPINDETGAIPYTLKEMGQTYGLDDRGVIEIKMVQEYGNFGIQTLSRKVQKRINILQSLAIASSVYRARNQYRIYGSNGTGLIMTIIEGDKGVRLAFSEFEYPVNVACAWDGEDSNGKDVVFFGTDDGKVFQADKGSSFDGDNIEGYMFLAFNHSKSPNVLKTYRYANLEMTAEKYTALQVNTMFSFGDPDIPQHVIDPFEMSVAGGRWDVDTWDTFFYDSEVVAVPTLDINGDGTNISIAFYSDTDIDYGHKIDALTVYYTPRRLVR